MKLTVRVLGVEVLAVELGPRMPEPPPTPPARTDATTAHRHSGDFGLGFAGSVPGSWQPRDVEAGVTP